MAQSVQEPIVEEKIEKVEAAKVEPASEPTAQAQSDVESAREKQHQKNQEYLDDSPDVSVASFFTFLVLLHEVRSTQVFSAGTVCASVARAAFPAVRHPGCAARGRHHGRSRQAQAAPEVGERVAEGQDRHCQVRSQREKCGQASEGVPESAGRCFENRPDHVCL